MPFIKEVINWNNQGSNIPSQVSNEGWKTLQSPAPAYFNKFWHTTTEALKELQSDAIHKDQKGATNGVAPLVGGKIPSQYLEESGSTVQGNLDKHIKEDIGHVRFLGSTIGTNTMELISDGLIPFVDDNATNPVPKTGVALRFVKTDNNNGSVTLRIRDTKLGKSTLNYGLFNSQNKTLQAGELVNGVIYTASFNGTSFFLQGSGSGVNSGTQGYQQFSTIGTNSFVVPEGVTRIIAYMWGGGGGGGGGQSYLQRGGGGGGAGAFRKSILQVTPNSNLTIVVGKGGAGGAGGADASTTGLNGAYGEATSIVGQMNGMVRAYGGGFGSGAGITLRGGAGGTGADRNGFGAGGFVTETSSYRNGAIEITPLSDVSKTLVTITGATGSFSNGPYGGGGGGASSDIAPSTSGGITGGLYYNNGVFSTYSVYGGGAGGNGAGGSLAARSGARGGGGGGGNGSSPGLENGGNGGDGFVVLVW